MQVFDAIEDLEAYIELLVQDLDVGLDDGVAPNLNSLTPQASHEGHVATDFNVYRAEIPQAPSSKFIQASTIEESIDERVLDGADHHFNATHSFGIRGYAALNAKAKFYPQNDASVTDGEHFTFLSIPTNAALTISNTADKFGQAMAVHGDYGIYGAQAVSTGTGAAYIYDVTTGELVHSINNPTPYSYDFFGSRVSISEDHYIIGAYGDNAGATSSGSAYVYDLATHTLLHTLHNSTPENYDHFGKAVALSENYALIAAPSDNTAAEDAGAAYIYSLKSGSLLHTLYSPAPNADDEFGLAVDLSDSYALIGVYHDDTGATNSGAAYVYDVTSGNLLYSFQNPWPGNHDYFGSAVSISGDYAVVGAYRDSTGAIDAGSAYIYDLTSGNLAHTINNPSPDNYDNFGEIIATHGGYALIVAPNEDADASNAGMVYVYDLAAGSLVETIHNLHAGNTEHFGEELSVTNNTAVIGVSSSNTTYVVYGDFDNDGIVSGSASDDTLYGLDGDDILTGLGGNDTLYGGAGADTFSFRSHGAGDMDRIEDFSVSDGDILDISDILSGYSGGDELTDFARIIDDTVNTGNAYLMIDGNGAADNSQDFTSVAYIVNGAGLDIETLFDSGQIIV